MNYNQIIVRLLLKSEDEKAQVYSIELNVLENFNIKLLRDEVSDNY